MTLPSEILITRRKDNNLGVQVTAEGLGRQATVPASTEKMHRLLQMSARSGILPPVVRWISPAGRGVLFERPPSEVTINYFGVKQDAIDDKKTNQQFTLQLPWMLYAILFDPKFRPAKIRMYAMRSSIQSPMDPLEMLPLPNIYSTGEFCLPTQNQWVLDDSIWTMADGINAAYDQIWESGFNRDVTDLVTRAYQEMAPKQIFAKPHPSVKAANILKIWERYGRDDILQWKWLPANVRVTHVMHWLIETEQTDYGLQMISTQLRSANM